MHAAPQSALALGSGGDFYVISTNAVWAKARELLETLARDHELPLEG